MMNSGPRTWHSCNLMKSSVVIPCSYKSLTFSSEVLIWRYRGKIRKSRFKFLFCWTMKNHNLNATGTAITWFALWAKKKNRKKWNAWLKTQTKELSPYPIIKPYHMSKTGLWLYPWRGRNLEGCYAKNI